jgi:hypothetical protein
MLLYLLRIICVEVWNQKLRCGGMRTRNGSWGHNATMARELVFAKKNATMARELVENAHYPPTEWQYWALACCQQSGGT